MILLRGGKYSLSADQVRSAVGRIRTHVEQGESGNAVTAVQDAQVVPPLTMPPWLLLVRVIRYTPESGTERIGFTPFTNVSELPAAAACCTPSIVSMGRTVPKLTPKISSSTGFGLPVWKNQGGFVDHKRNCCMAGSKREDRCG